ncbi:MAG: hypothetical protein K6T83_16450 [Alicyclobacillus sp.]|nr:hypothetical protein [Alicyclobacillus sp.]
MAVAIQIGFIKVGAIQSDAGVFFGQNMQNGWDSHTKSNSAGPSASGTFNVLPAYFNLVYDPDFIDVPINDQDIKSPTFAHIMGV